MRYKGGQISNFNLGHLMLIRSYSQLDNFVDTEESDECFYLPWGISETVRSIAPDSVNNVLASLQAERDAECASEVFMSE